MIAWVPRNRMGTYSFTHIAPKEHGSEKYSHSTTTPHTDEQKSFPSTLKDIFKPLIKSSFDPIPNDISKCHAQLHLTEEEL